MCLTVTNKRTLCHFFIFFFSVAGNSASYNRGYLRLAVLPGCIEDNEERVSSGQRAGCVGASRWSDRTCLHGEQSWVTWGQALGCLGAPPTGSSSQSTVAEQGGAGERPEDQGALGREPWRMSSAEQAGVRSGLLNMWVLCFVAVPWGTAGGSVQAMAWADTHLKGQCEWCVECRLLDGLETGVKAGVGPGGERSFH